MFLSIMDTISYIASTVLERVTDIETSENATSYKQPLFLTLWYYPNDGETSFKIPFWGSS